VLDENAGVRVPVLIVRLLRVALLLWGVAVATFEGVEVPTPFWASASKS
jgi:hypothetical protein